MDRTWRKKKNDKKECKTGITSWKAVDEKGFVYTMVFEDSKKFKKFQKERNLNFGIAMAEYIETKIPKGRYTFVIDAGALGGPATATYLRNTDRKFLISCAQNE